MPALRRLPGIAFEARTPPVGDVLPRMDIAAFVGFAASGPLHAPVVIEDVVRFHEIFGEDQRLAWDRDRGSANYAELAPAVRAFFRNGGRRCWVVRVADERTAITNRFPLPGVLAARTGSTPNAAVAIARAPGSWSDDLRVNATVTIRPLPVLDTPPAAPGQIQVTNVGSGDLLQIGTDSSPEIGYLAVPQPPGGARRATSAQRSLELAKGHWFRPAQPDDCVVSASRAPSNGITWFADPVRARWLTGGAVDGDAGALDDPALPQTGFGHRDGAFVMELPRALTTGMVGGAWIRIDVAVSPDAIARPILLMQVDEVDHSGESATSPAGDEEALIVASRAWWVLDALAASAHVASAPLRAVAIELELWVHTNATGMLRRAGLGLASDHSRYWGYAPDDAILFRPDRGGRPAGTQQRASNELLGLLDHPRFPLAAPAIAEDDSGPLFIPLGVGSLAEDVRFQPALRRNEPALARDGLASFDASLFLDDALASSSTITLLADAFDVQFVARAGNGAIGRALRGIHAVLPVAEVSMIAAPDAAQRTWSLERMVHVGLDAPQLAPITSPDGDSTARLQWTAAQDAATYDLQRSTDARFVRATTVSSGDALAANDVPPASECSVRYFYRVRARASDGRVSPWSNTRSAAVPRPTFEICGGEEVAAPTALTLTESGGRVVLEWATSPVPAFGQTYSWIVERASDAGFESAQTIYRGGVPHFEVWHTPDRAAYYRVAFTLDGRDSAWSETRTAGTVQLEAFQMAEVADYDPDILRRVQLGAFRLCAARGDAHALLALPMHYREASAIDHLAALSAALASEGLATTLSFGALFHPWPIVRETSGALHDAIWPVSPEGAIAGAIADRTLHSGAWYSVGNQILQGVVSLAPVLGDRAVAMLLAAGINPIAQQPRGFAALASQTPTDLPELGELHVRRLLILLRRLAVREGSDLVFQTNDDALRRLAERKFNALLGRLYVRGAFAGGTHQQAYRVVADASVNQSSGVDLGRFIVELRVAPSRPLAFLTIRLVQRGGELLTAQET